MGELYIVDKADTSYLVITASLSFRYDVFSMSNEGTKNASLTNLGVDFTVGTGGVYTAFIYGSNQQVGN